MLPYAAVCQVVSCKQLRLCDMVFNAVFSAEAVAKIGAYGFYTPRSIDFAAYMSSGQNQVLCSCCLVYAPQLGSRELVL